MQPVSLAFEVLQLCIAAFEQLQVVSEVVLEGCEAALQDLLVLLQLSDLQPQTSRPDN